MQEKYHSAVDARSGDVTLRQRGLSMSAADTKHTLPDNDEVRT